MKEPLQLKDRLLSWSISCILMCIVFGAASFIQNTGVLTSLSLGTALAAVIFAIILLIISTYEEIKKWKPFTSQ